MGCGTREKYSWSSLEKYKFNDYEFARNFDVDTITIDGRIILINDYMYYFFLA